MLAYVTGAVMNPQTTVQLPPESRVQDAINAAGGLLPNADLERVNLAGIVRDGDQIHVYAIGESSTVALPTESGGGLVHINSATLEEIETLPGIGPVIAQRIIDYRTQNGPFPDLNALQNVSGIGPATLANIASQVVID